MMSLQPSGDGPVEQIRSFDVSLPLRHTYLGEVEDLVSNSGTFESGTECVLPLLALPGLVLMPGGTLPLRVIYDHQVQVVKAAMKAALPYTCLLVVVCQNLLTQGHSIVGTVAEVRQANCRSNGTVSCLAIGRQRCQVKRMRGSRQAEVVLMADDCCITAPQEGRVGAAFWAGWVHALFDPQILAKEACNALASVAPCVKQPQNLDPRMMSYWLSETAPLGYKAKQNLLTIKNTTYRLQELIKVLGKMKFLICRRCGEEVAEVSSLISMTEAGTGSVFVNAYGYTHDLVTSTGVRNVVLVGDAEDEHSWFPGYKWTICQCTKCLDQVGWKFEAKDPTLRPKAFWGIRSQAIRYSAYPLPFCLPGDADID